MIKHVKERLLVHLISGMYILSPSWASVGNLSSTLPCYVAVTIQRVSEGWGLSSLWRYWQSSMATGWKDSASLSEMINVLNDGSDVNVVRIEKQELNYIN